MLYARGIKIRGCDGSMDDGVDGLFVGNLALKISFGHFIGSPLRFRQLNFRGWMDGNKLTSKLQY